MAKPKVAPTPHEPLTPPPLTLVAVNIQRSGWLTTAARLTTALGPAIAAIGPLDYDDKRRVIRWLCDVFGIDPKAL
jgi:hypothetical protein